MKAILFEGFFTSLGFRIRIAVFTLLVMLSVLAIPFVVFSHY